MKNDVRDTIKCGPLVDSLCIFQ